ncbi:MAG: SpoIIE family protein phosphatase [Chloroflexales bacterium]|nr:SpoIIE family protein phosphatase [Chloroflexales bacterium]
MPTPTLPRLTLAARLLRWGSPVPAGQGALRARFEQESQAAMGDLMASFYPAFTLFFTFFTLTDWLLYRADFWQLLPLRISLIGIGLVGWRLNGRVRGQGTPLLWTLLFSLSMAVIAEMLVVNGDPAGLYAVTFIVSPAMLALLPMPLVWYVINTALLTIIYVAPLWLAGHLGTPGVAAFILALIGCPPLFGFIQVSLARQRWESFANRVRAEQLSERLSSELATARRIQKSLLPPPYPRWPTPDLACWSEPAREVGGDFYTYARISDGRVGLSVGDVSGKGLPAAMLVSTCLALLRAATAGAASPGALLGAIDRALASSTQVTRQNCALCCVELADNRLRAANAGGVSPLLRRADGRVEWVEAVGLPLGTGLSDLGYHDVCAEVAPGDLLLLVSDGVVEAMDEAGQIFGFERLEAAAAALRFDSAFAAVAELRDALAGFTGPADPHDDMTIVALRVPG